MKVGNKSGVAALVIGLGLVGFATPAGARRRVEARADSPLCGAAYGRALERVQQARLKEAQELFGMCARASCGEDLRRECAGRRARLEGDIPSIVPLVTDNAGEPRVLVEVRIDGVLVTSRLDGRAIAIDPGKHEIAFSNDDGVFATRTLVVVEGERNLPIHVALHAADAPALRRARELMPTPPRPTEAGAVEPLPAKGSSSDVEEGSPRDQVETRSTSLESTPAPDATATRVVRRDEGRSPFTYVLGGVGLAGVGGYVLLSTWGKKDNDLLASHCGLMRDCAPASVEHIHKLYLEANVSGGVGLAAMAVSTWLFLRTPSAQESPPADQAVSLRAKRKSMVTVQRVDVTAAPSGAIAMLGGAF